MHIIGLVIPWRYRKPLLSSQPDKSESASESLTSGTYSGQWRSGGPIGAENPAGAPDILPNSPEPGQHPGKLYLMVSMCAWTVYYTTCHRAGNVNTLWPFCSLQGVHSNLEECDSGS